MQSQCLLLLGVVGFKWGWDKARRRSRNLPQAVEPVGVWKGGTCLLHANEENVPNDA